MYPHPVFAELRPPVDEDVPSNMVSPPFALRQSQCPWLKRPHFFDKVLTGASAEMAAMPLLEVMPFPSPCLPFYSKWPIFRLGSRRRAHPAHTGKSILLSFGDEIPTCSQPSQGHQFPMSKRLRAYLSTFCISNLLQHIHFALSTIPNSLL